MALKASQYPPVLVAVLYLAILMVLIAAYSSVTIGIAKVFIGFGIAVLLVPPIAYALTRLDRGVDNLNRSLDDMQRSQMLDEMRPSERAAFLFTEGQNRRFQENEERERQYLDAIAGPQMWCLLAMREGRNFARGDVEAKDVEDILAWAASNNIAVTVISRTDKDAKLSFGELRRARKTARFMGEPV